MHVRSNTFNHATGQFESVLTLTRAPVQFERKVSLIDDVFAKRPHFETIFFVSLRKKLTMRGVTKTKQMNQKRRRKRLKRTWRKMGQCRTVTQSTTTTTARPSKSKQVWWRKNVRRTHIPQWGSRREGWKEGEKRRGGGQKGWGGGVIL